jgi:CBS-domain-containing membrane protein
MDDREALSCVTPGDLLDAVAAAVQQGRFRHIPVVASDGRLLGIVSDRDLREQKGYWSSSRRGPGTRSWHTHGSRI